MGDESAGLLVAPPAGGAGGKVEPVDLEGSAPVSVVVLTGWTTIVDVPDVVVATTVIVATSSVTTMGCSVPPFIHEQEFAGSSPGAKQQKDMLVPEFEHSAN
jgi:hypothetical protein